MCWKLTIDGQTDSSRLQDLSTRYIGTSSSARNYLAVFLVSSVVELVVGGYRFRIFILTPGREKKDGGNNITLYTRVLHCLFNLP